MTGSMIWFTLALVFAAILSKFVGCGVAAKLCKFSNKESIQIGVGMIARGEVSFIVAAKAIMVGHMTAALYPSIIIVVLVTVLITPLLLKQAFK